MISSPAPIRVLLVDDDATILEGLGDFLELEGLSTLRYADGRVLLDELPSIAADVALVDIRMPHLDGLQVLPHLHRELDIPVIMLTGFGDIETAVRAIRLGAYDFQTKPAPPQSLLRLIQRAVDHDRLRRENEVLKRTLTDRSPFDRLVGNSPVMRRLVDLARTIADADGAVLIRGETGTGKELVARAIHGASMRRDRPFVAINCAALSPALLESAMFGHERGSFTGAEETHEGHLEQADGGTLFLDEVGSMPLEVQAKLLRVLESRAFRRLGSSKERQVDLRVIAATNHDLRDAIEMGCFRQDLFYRLDVLPIFLPPLRSREGDVPLLAMHFLREAAARMGKLVSGFTSHALSVLESHPWPGNVRELKNVIERAVCFSQNGLIEEIEIHGRDDSLPSSILRPVRSAGSAAPGTRDRSSCTPASPDATRGTAPSPSGDSVRTSSSRAAFPPFAEARDRLLADFERRYLEELLEHASGNLRAVARLSGMSYKTLQRKLKQHEIDRNRFRI